MHVYPPPGRGRPTQWELAAWLHAVLAAEDWYGIELDGLVREWADRASTPLVVVWVDAEREGVDVDELSREVAGAPITVVKARSVGVLATQPE